jgi:ParB-like chromosome segregation protein Spo0J
MNLADLRPDPANPRTITGEALSALRASLREFGDISGFVYSTRHGGKLICGHQRLTALKAEHGDALNLEGEPGEPSFALVASGVRFPIRVVSDWTDAQERAANVAANSQYLAGDFTDDLQVQLEELRVELPELEELRLDQLFDVEKEGAIRNFDVTPKAKPEWIMISCPSDVAAEILSVLEAFKRENGVRIEATV